MRINHKRYYFKDAKNNKYFINYLTVSDSLTVSVSLGAKGS